MGRQMLLFFGAKEEVIMGRYNDMDYSDWLILKKKFDWINVTRSRCKYGGCGAKVKIAVEEKVAVQNLKYEIRIGLV